MPKIIHLLPTIFYLVVLASIFADEQKELDEQKQIVAILKKTEHAEYHDRTHLPEAYNEAHQKLSALKVCDSNRVKLLQSRTLIAVLSQNWDDFRKLAKEFEDNDPWFWKVTIWELQARVARKEWKPFADDVSVLVNSISKKEIPLANSNDPTSQFCYQLLRLRIALSCFKDEKLPLEFQTIVDQIIHLEKSHSEIPQGALRNLQIQFEREFQWLVNVVP